MNEPDPWKVQTSRHIHEARALNVRLDRVRMPNGRTIEDYAVIESSPWVTVVPITADDEIVFVRQYRHALGQVGLELPGGYVETDDPIEDAKRELLEETGYGAGSWRLMRSVAPNPAILNNWNHWVIADGVEKVAEPEPDEGEDLVVVKRPASDIPEVLGSGEIYHALHVGALLNYLYEESR